MAADQQIKHRGTLIDQNHILMFREMMNVVALTCSNSVLTTNCQIVLDTVWQSPATVYIIWKRDKRYSLPVKRI